MNLEDRSARGRARLESHLRFYKGTSLILLALVVLLSAILIVGGRRRFARAIKVDGELICLVKDQEAAQRVHQLLLEEERGTLPGDASLEEQWEDEPWPVEDREVLSVHAALELLRERAVTVLVDATTLEIDGHKAFPMPGEDFARDVLDAIKARHMPEGEQPVESQTFLEEVRIVSIRSNAEDVVTEIGSAVERLSQTRAEAETYTVRSGDYPQKIAADHGMTSAEFYELNPDLQGHLIHPGDEVKVAPEMAGLTVRSVTQVRETFEVEPEVERVYSASVPRGETRGASEGTPGTELRVKHRTYHNDRVVEEKTTETQIVEPPSPKRVLVGTSDAPAAGGDD